MTSECKGERSSVSFMQRMKNFATFARLYVNKYTFFLKIL